jgi:hypothetical protein
MNSRMLKKVYLALADDIRTCVFKTNTHVRQLALSHARVFVCVLVPFPLPDLEKHLLELVHWTNVEVIDNIVRSPHQQHCKIMVKWTPRQPDWLWASDIYPQVSWGSLRRDWRSRKVNFTAKTSMRLSRGDMRRAR